VAVRNHIHSLSPFPGAWMMLGDIRIKVLKARVVAGAGRPGTVLDDALTVACGEGALQLLELQREGKGAMTADAFLRGTAVAKGESFS
jgi:methionyl-tRNA formyltransferase